MNLSVNANTVLAKGATYGRALTDIIGDSYNAKSFGALANGSDDTAAIQAAINAAQASASGGTVVLPPGTYTVASKLTISGAQTVWLVGAGWGHNSTADGGTVIKFTGTTNCLEIGNTSADQTADIRIQGIRFEGNALAADAIKVMRTHSMLIEGCRIEYFGGNGIEFDRAYANKIIRNYVNNNTGSGFKCNEQNDFTLIRWNHFLANTAKGIWFSNGSSSGSRIIENDIEGNAVGVQVDAGSSADQAESYCVGWNYFESQTGKNMSFAEDGSVTRFVDNLLVIGNQINVGTGTAATNAVALDRCRRPTVASNIFNTSNLTSTAGTTLLTLNGNFWNASTYPTTGLRFSTADDAITRIGGTLPSSLWQSNGWAVAHHLGMQTAGDTFEWGNNFVSTSATQGTLDDINTAGFLLRMSPTGLKMYYAASGANPATLVPITNWVSAGVTGLAYGATVNTDASTATSFTIIPTNGSAFTIAAPTNPGTGQRISIRIINTFGGLGVATWNGVFKMAAWTQPANGFSRSIDFVYNGTNWVECARNTSDIPN